MEVAELTDAGQECATQLCINTFADNKAKICSVVRNSYDLGYLYGVLA